MLFREFVDSSAAAGLSQGIVGNDHRQHAAHLPRGFSL